MNKKLLAVFLAITLICLSIIPVIGADDNELPIVPFIPPADATTPTVRLSSNASSTVYHDDDIKFTTKISGFGENGLSKAELKYTYSAGLAFNGDIKVDNLPSGWSVTNTINSANKLTFTVSDSTGNSPIIDSTLTLTFSFNVTALSGDNLSINLSNTAIYDKDGKTIEHQKRESGNNFSTESKIPEMNNLGASLRINNEPAIAFGMSVRKDSAFKAAFPSGKFTYSPNSNIRFGMLVIEKSKLSGELTVNTANAEVVYFSKTSSINTSSNSNEIVFSYTINSITDYTKEYTFRPFIAYRENSSTPFTYYYDTVKTRSAEYIAEAELKNETNTKKIEMLEKFTEQ